jgi:hypothetical protein
MIAFFKGKPRGNRKSIMLKINHNRRSDGASMPAAASILQAARNGTRQSLSDALKRREVALAGEENGRGKKRRGNTVMRWRDDKEP